MASFDLAVFFRRNDNILRLDSSMELDILRVRVVSALQADNLTLKKI
jgi:hypothetical protein